MGVSGLSQWLSRTFPDCFRNYHVSSPSSSSSSSASSALSSRRKGRVIRYDPLPMQHVALDLMSMLHNLLARSASTHPMFFFREVFEQVDAVLEAFPPEVSLVLALDGPAPAAKWVKQKRRRVKTSNKEASTKAAIDKLELTPGTTFMEEVKNALCHYACSRLLSSPSPSRIYVSGATVPGEGELKLVQLLLYEEKRAREKQRRKKTKKKKKKKKKRQKRNEIDGNGLAAAENANGEEETSARASLIVGDDSDLLLLAICGMVSGGRATSVFAPCKGYDQLFSVARLFGYFRETFPQNGNEEEKACHEEFIRRTAVDFVLLVVFMGNDYIPKFQGVEWGDLWRSYVQLKQNNEKMKQQFLVDVDQHNELTLNLPLLYHILISTKRLCQFLNCHTKLFHAKETPKEKEKEKEKEAEVDDLSSNLQEEEQEEEDDSNLFFRHWDVPAYLQALLWNIHMYLFANCGDYDFHYSFPHSPPADQLILWIQRHYHHLSYPSSSTAPSSPSSSAPSLALETTSTSTSPISVRSANAKSEPLLPHLFCLAVMPSWAKDFVVAPLRHLVMDIDTNNNNRNTNGVEKENNEAEEEEEEACPTRTVPTALNSMQLHMQTRRFSQLIQREAQRVELGKYSPQERRTIDFALNLLFKKKKQKEQKHSIPTVGHEQKTKRKKMEDEEKEEEKEAEDVLAFEVPEGIVAEDKQVLRSLLQGRRVRLLLDEEKGERDGLVLPLWKNENKGREDVMKLVPVDAYRHQWDPHFRPVEESNASASSTTKENEAKQKKNRSKYRNLVHL
ncbi:5'-3' exoribonuclease 2 [Balamuthia mandrillaris]